VESSTKIINSASTVHTKDYTFHQKKVITSGASGAQIENTKTGNYIRSIHGTRSETM
jgi:hypothetical protein